MDGVPEWVIYAAVGLGMFVSTIFGGRLRHGDQEGPTSRISGAAIVDSSIGKDLVVELRKLRLATERVADLMAKRDETERHNADIRALQREIAALRGGDGRS